MKNQHEGSKTDSFDAGRAKPLQQAGSGNNPYERDSDPNTPVLKNSRTDPGPTPFNTSIKGV